MKKVLITGANGWIGKHVVPLFTEDWEVHVTTSSKFQSSNFEIHTINLLDHQQITQLIQHVRPTHCIHLAWIATPGIYTTSEENHAWKNASLHLFSELINNDVEHITGIGSSFEYDWSNGHCIEGITPLEPNTLYGTCKRDCGLQLLEMASKAGVTASWGRVFFLYGPDEPEKKLVAATINALLRKTTVDTSAGTQLRDYMHVDDVAAAIHHLTMHECIGDYNISNGTAVTVRSIVEQIEHATRTKGLVQYGARPMAAHEPILIEGNSKKLQSTGWTTKYTLESGIQQSVDWWKEKIKID